MKWIKRKKSGGESKQVSKPLVCDANTCLVCGALLPEGLMVCSNCESGAIEHRCGICKRVIPQGIEVCPWCEEVLINSRPIGDDPSPKQ